MSPLNLAIRRLLSFAQCWLGEVVCGGEGHSWRAETEARLQWVGKNGRKGNVREIIAYSFVDIGFKRENRFDFIVQIISQVLGEYCLLNLASNCLTSPACLSQSGLVYTEDEWQKEWNELIKLASSEPRMHLGTNGANCSG